MNIRIEKMTAEHWPAVREIYAIGIATKNATFEQQPPTWDVWHKSHWPGGRFVAIDKNSVLGWAALSPISNRCVAGRHFSGKRHQHQTAQKIGISTCRHSKKNWLYEWRMA
jgi:L-amino acid N-acyltransferase YncA